MVTVRVEFEHSVLERRLEPTIEAAAYRIVQEALSNVARHAGKTEASAQLLSNDQTIFIQINDGGLGFDVNTRWLAAPAED